MMDVALNPMLDDRVFPSWEEWNAVQHDYPETPDDDPPRTVARFRAFLESRGYDGIVLENAETDLPLLRRDVVVFDPGAIRIVEARRMPARPELAGLDVREVHGLLTKELYAANDPDLAVMALGGVRRRRDVETEQQRQTEEPAQAPGMRR